MAHGMKKLRAIEEGTIVRTERQTGKCLSAISIVSSRVHSQKNPRVPLNFLSAILGPDMGAPILWAPGMFAFFLQETLHVRKIPLF